jgi:hypothetical protein
MQKSEASKSFESSRIHERGKIVTLTASSPGSHYKHRRPAGRPRTNSDSPLVPLTVSIDPDQKEKLEQIAKAQERSVSFIFREALDLYFEKRKKAA